MTMAFRFALDQRPAGRAGLQTPCNAACDKPPVDAGGRTR
jgi:hypothetical protein